jgi:hypothetical protein
MTNPKASKVFVRKLAIVKVETDGGGKESQES